jgi:hypothetical protein
MPSRIVKLIKFPFKVFLILLALAIIARVFFDLI